ncbi:MAG: 6-bladed beta-propeller [Prevotellaceae bacterium]|jgi:hypothetical protein|nr:6-bladed beta-propeller [Prevotellaceae bacterium]
MKRIGKSTALEAFKTICHINAFVMFFCLCCFFSCSNNKTGSNRSIEIIYAKSDIKESASNIFEQIKVIPLELTDLSLIGKSIDRMEIWDGKLFMRNFIGMVVGKGAYFNILCFDLSGKSLYNIDRIGQGPGEYTCFFDFFVDENLQHLILVGENKRFMHFDLNGNFLYNIYSDDQYYARHSIYLNDSTYLSLNDAAEPVPGFEGYSLLYIDAASMNVRHKTNSINEFYFTGNQPFSKYGDRILCHTFIDSIFDISDSANVKAAYYFYYSDIQETLHQNWTKMTKMERNHSSDESYSSGQSTHIHAMYETAKYLVFGCMKANPEANNSINYILFYDKKNKKVYDSDNIDFDGFILKNVELLGTYDESLYCILYSEITDEDKEKIRNSKAFSDEDRKTLLEHSFEDNPLLFVLK